MKRFLIFVLALTLLGGGVAGYFWLNRYDLALERLQTDTSRGPVTDLAIETLLDFADRPDLEKFIRESYLAEADRISKIAPEGSRRGSRFRGEIASAVYEAQPDRVDEALMAAVMTANCANSCAQGAFAKPREVRAPYWMKSVQDTAAFRTALRTATIRLSGLPTGGNENDSEETFDALGRFLATHNAAPDLELAQAIATRVVRIEPMEREAKRFVQSVSTIGGDKDLPKVWAAAFAAEPQARLQLAWNSVAETLLRATPPNNIADIEGLAAFCARRSVKFAEAACVDLGLAWGDTWSKALAGAGTGELATGVKNLIAGKAKVTAMSWQSIVDGYKKAPAPKPHGGPPTGTRGVSAMDMSKGYKLRREAVRRVAVLSAAGKAAVPKLLSVYRSTGRTDILRECLEILARHAPEIVAKDVADSIPKFRTVAHAFASGMKKLDYDKYYDLGYRIGLGLAQLRVHSPTHATTPLLLSLSIPDPGFSEYASSALRQTLNAEQFANGLFRFLASRSSFSAEEVKRYESTLVSYPQVGPHIARNMERMLEEAKGRPERVPWIQKYIGLNALNRVGEKSAQPILARYAKDTSSYEKVSTEKLTGKSRSTKKSFAELAQKAIASVAKR